ncbi:MAG: hypothetical protein ABW166_12055 [Sedimenticola sp.]
MNQLVGVPDVPDVRPMLIPNIPYAWDREMKSIQNTGLEKN